MGCLGDHCMLLFIPRLFSFSLAEAHFLQLHGRTRQQRYTKLADWDYVKQCVQAVRAREEEEGRTYHSREQASLAH